MRKTYRFNHGIKKGGYVYAHKARSIENKQGLRNALEAIALKHELIDVTILTYDNIFFIFYMARPTMKQSELIESIQANCSVFADWHDQYIHSTIYALKEKYIRSFLQKLGINYDDG